MVPARNFHLIPDRFKPYVLTYKNITALIFLEKEKIIKITNLPSDGFFEPEINLKKIDNLSSSKGGYRSNIFNNHIDDKKEPFPFGLVFVSFNDNLVKKFICEKLKEKTTIENGGWVNKKNGEYQFPNGKTHQEKAKIKKKIFIEMMDLYEKTAIVPTLKLAEQTAMSAKRIRTEINQISNKMEKTVGYVFKSERKGFYELHNLTNN